MWLGSLNHPQITSEANYDVRTIFQAIGLFWSRKLSQRVIFQLTSSHNFQLGCFYGSAIKKFTQTLLFKKCKNFHLAWPAINGSATTFLRKFFQRTHFQLKYRGNIARPFPHNLTIRVFWAITFQKVKCVFSISYQSCHIEHTGTDFSVLAWLELD